MGSQFDNIHPGLGLGHHPPPEVIHEDHYRTCGSEACSMSGNINLIIVLRAGAHLTFRICRDSF